ncbi:MAG: glycosyltransferase [Deltaproteobacteria bacterium]|nr:glycosyltransferase [Deltaproteobacteria bacterium]
MTRRKSGKICVSDLRLLACGFFLEQYPRYDTLWEGLSRLDFQQLIDLRDKRVYNDKYIESQRYEESRGSFHSLARKIRSLYRIPRYAISISNTAYRKKVDVIFVFPGNLLLVICLGLLKFLHHAKVYFDLFDSEYLTARRHSIGRFSIVTCYILELLSSKFADELICVTPEYASYYQNLYKIRDDKLNVVIDGIQDIWFDEPAGISHEVHRPKRVLYWGNFLFLHGFDLILDAAEELRNEDIEFILCGRGDKEAWIRQEAQKRNLSNVILKGFVPTTKELIHIIDGSDITLGHFRDIYAINFGSANKVREGMARGKPVITIWTKQQEDLYQTKDNPFPPLIQIEPSAKSLAKAIIEILNDPLKAERIGKKARSTAKRLLGIEAITSALKESLEKTLENGK